MIEKYLNGAIAPTREGGVRYIQDIRTAIIPELVPETDSLQTPVQ